MTISAVDANGMLNADFAAYTKLTLVNRLQHKLTGRQVGPPSTLTFQQFMEALQKGEVVNHRYSRPVSSEEIANDRIYSTLNGAGGFGTQRFSTIEKAYELGLVNPYGYLISSFESRA